MVRPTTRKNIFTSNNKDGTNFKKKSVPYHPSPYSFFRRMRIIAGSQVVEVLIITIVFIICFLN